MTLEAVETAEAPAPAATPAAAESKPSEVRVVSEKELAERHEADLDSKLKQIVRNAKREREGRDPDSGKFVGKTPPSSAEGDAVKALDAPEKPDKANSPADKANSVSKDEKPKEIKGDKTANSVTEKANSPTDAPKYEAPKHWTDTAKEKFTKLDPETQKELLEVSKGERQALTKLGQTVKQYEPIGKLLDEHKETFRSKGLTYEQGLTQLLKAQVALDNNPVEGIKKLAAHYRVDLSEIAAQKNDLLSNLPPDPEVDALKSEIAQLKQALQGVTGHIQQDVQTRRQAQSEQLTNAVIAFSKDKPDFDDLEADFERHFVSLHRSNPGLGLDALMAQAYEAARWGNPATRQRALEAELKAAEEKRQKALRDAQKANALNVTSQPGPAESGDLDDKLRAIARRRAA